MQVNSSYSTLHKARPCKWETSYITVSKLDIFLLKELWLVLKVWPYHIKFICKVLQFNLLPVAFPAIYKHWSKPIQSCTNKNVVIFCLTPRASLLLIAKHINQSWWKPLGVRYFLVQPFCFGKCMVTLLCKTNWEGGVLIFSEQKTHFYTMIGFFSLLF